MAFPHFFPQLWKTSGGDPTEGAAGDVTLAQGRGPDNATTFLLDCHPRARCVSSSRLVQLAVSSGTGDGAAGNALLGLTLPSSLRYYRGFSATCFWRKGIRDHETYVPAKPSSSPSHARLLGAHEHEKRAARPEASAGQGPEAADGFVAGLIDRSHHAPAAAGARSCSPSASPEIAEFAGAQSSSGPFPSEPVGMAATSHSSSPRTLAA
jgi:hypothetical protein